MSNIYNLKLNLSNGETLEAGSIEVPAGPIGPTGATGLNGPTGATGATGPQGTRGSIWTVSSSSNPADPPSDGYKANDLCLISDGTIIKYDGSGWNTTYVSIKGPQGESGTPGKSLFDDYTSLKIDTTNSNVAYTDNVAHITNARLLGYSSSGTDEIETALDIPIKAGENVTIEASEDNKSILVSSNDVITNHEVIVYADALPEANETSPNFVQTPDGTLYRKKVVELTGIQLVGTWVFNDSPSITGNATYNITFTSNGQSYSSLSTYYSPTAFDMQYDSIVVYSGAKGAGNWDNTSYKTIQITDISALTNLELFMVWLTANATRQGGNTYVLYEYIAVHDNSANVVIGETINSLKGGKTYIQCDISATISASFSEGGNYYFINCYGSITTNSTLAKIYITDSPNLTVSGITSTNWKNIWIDGVASYGQAIRFLNGVQILKSSEFSNPNAPSEKLVSFQVAFASNDYIISVAPNVADTDYKFYKAMPAVEHVSASQFKLKFISFDGGEQVSPAVDYIAIGRWK